MRHFSTRKRRGGGQRNALRESDAPARLDTAARSRPGVLRRLASDVVCLDFCLKGCVGCRDEPDWEGEAWEVVRSPIRGMALSSSRKRAIPGAIS